MTHKELQQAETFLRRDDKALRLRRSMEEPDTIFVERKTFRGRIGKLMPTGEDFPPDAGRRREEGHVWVCKIRESVFNKHDLRTTLQMNDTWKQKPLWQRVEEDEAYDKAVRAASRMQDHRYKASEFWDTYAWRTKARVSVGEQVAATPSIV